MSAPLTFSEWSVSGTGVVKKDGELFEMPTMMHVALITRWLVARDENVQVNGSTFIFDMTGVGAKHVARFTSDDMRKWHRHAQVSQFRGREECNWSVPLNPEEGKCNLPRCQKGRQTFSCIGSIIIKVTYSVCMGDKPSVNKYKVSGNKIATEVCLDARHSVNTGKDYTNVDFDVGIIHRDIVGVCVRVCARAGAYIYTRGIKRNASQKLERNINSKFELIIGKIIKIITNKCHIFRLKYTKFDFGWSFAPLQTPLEELAALP